MFRFLYVLYMYLQIYLMLITVPNIFIRLIINIYVNNDNHNINTYID